MEGDSLQENMRKFVQPIDGTTWLDLTSLNRAAIHSVLRQHELPPEVATYFLLRYRSPKLIHAGPALFLVTFMTIPSSRYLFLARELKICVAPTLVATICGSRTGASSTTNPLLTLSLSPREESSGQFLQQLFEGVLASYEEVVKILTKPESDRVAGATWGRRRIERLAHVLREQQALVDVLLRDGKKVLSDEEQIGFIQVEQRIEHFARTAWKIGRQTP